MYAKGDPAWDKPNVTWGKRIMPPFIGTYISKKDFVNWIKKNEIELIIFNEQRWFQPLLWCKELGIKTIAYIDYYTEISLPLFNIYDGLICNTKKHFDAFRNHPNASYIPWGTNVSLFKPASEGLVDEKRVTFFHSCGYDGDRKGTDLFIKALAECGDVDFKAVIHTQKDLKAQFPGLSDTIDRLSAQGKLQIITKTIPAPGLFHLGDVYVYPSRLEGIGLTIAEALASGLACIVPDMGPMNEFIDESCGATIRLDRTFAREDGYYWPKCEISISHLAELIRFYSSNKDLVARQKRAARQFAESKLSATENFQLLFPLMANTKFLEPTPELTSSIQKFDNTGLQRFTQNRFSVGVYRLYSLLKRN